VSLSLLDFLEATHYAFTIRHDIIQHSSSRISMIPDTPRLMLPKRSLGLAASKSLRYLLHQDVASRLGNPDFVGLLMPCLFASPALRLYFTPYSILRPCWGRLIIPI
jgi:hypothetical protein